MSGYAGPGSPCPIASRRPESHRAVRNRNPLSRRDIAVATADWRRQPSVRADRIDTSGCACRCRNEGWRRCRVSAGGCRVAMGKVLLG